MPTKAYWLVHIQECPGIVTASKVHRSGGVDVVIPTRRKPHHLLREFANVNLDIARHDLPVGKRGYVEPKLRAVASAVSRALTPGAVIQDIESLPFTREIRPVFPLDRDMPEPQWEIQVFPPIAKYGIRVDTR